MRSVHMQDTLKQQVAKRATEFVDDNSIIGIGTGSTVDYFIDSLIQSRITIEAAVASSMRTKQLLEQAHIPVYDLNAVGTVDLYIDGADQIDEHGYCLKGGGGALTQEKIVAAAAKTFICIVDQSKVVATLGGDTPVTLEVIPAARSYVGRACLAMGGNPIYREGVITDNGNVLIDVLSLDLTDIHQVDRDLTTIVGVVEHGIFVKQKPSQAIIATSTGINIQVF